MNKNKKMILVLVIALVIVYFILSSIKLLPRGKKYSGTIFIGDYTKVEIKNNNINVYNKNEEIRKQKAKIYFNNKFIDGYISTEEVDFNLLNYRLVLTNRDGERVFPGSGSLVHTDNFEIKVKDSSKNTSKDIDEINNFIKQANIIISSNIKLDYLYVNSLDIDDDGKEEYIYSTGLIEDSNEYDSMVFVKKENKYLLITREESNYDGIENIRLNFFKLIDFNNDGEYEFVVEKMMSEYGPNYYELYNFDGTKFNKIGGE